MGGVAKVLNKYLAFVCVLWAFKAPAFSLETRCLSVYEQRAQVRSLSQLIDCMKYFTDEPDFTGRISTFDRSIELGRRALEVEPRSIYVYQELSWLLFSQWSTWNVYHRYEPRVAGEDYYKEIFTILARGEELLGDDARFHDVAAKAVWNLAVFYMPEHYAFVIDHYKKADARATSTAFRVRIRLDLAYAYLRQGSRNEAVQTYHSVLKLDAHQKIAQRYLALLSQN